LSRTLDDTALADDRKVREYVTALHRYLNTRKELPPEASATVNPPIQPALADEQPPQQQQQLQQLPQQEVHQKKKKKKGRNKKQRRLAWDQRGSGSKRPPPFWEKY